MNQIIINREDASRQTTFDDKDGNRICEGDIVIGNAETSGKPEEKKYLKNALFVVGFYWPNDGGYSDFYFKLYTPLLPSELRGADNSFYAYDLDRSNTKIVGHINVS